jgi:hypothetical protein
VRLVGLSLPAWNTVALLDLSSVMQDGLIGAGSGAIVSRIFIHRSERRSGELPPRRVRQLEVRWTCALASAFFLVSLVLRVA